MSTERLKLKGEIAILTNRLITLQEQVKTYDDLTDSITSLKKETQKQEMTVKRNNDELQNILNKKEETNKDIENNKHELIQLKKQKEQEEINITSLKEEIVNINTSIAKMLKEQDKLAKELKIEEKKIEKRWEVFNLKQEESENEAESNLREINAEIHRMEKKKKEVENAIDKVKEAEKETKDQYNKQRVILSTKMQEVREAEQRVVECNQKEEKFNARIKEMTSNIGNLSRQKSKIEEMINEKQEELDNMAKEWESKLDTIINIKN